MIKNGYGNVLTPEHTKWLEDNLTEFVVFDIAARMIDPRWTRHHLHKELQSERIFRSKILIVVDDELNDKNSFNKAQRFFIHKSEIERLKEDVKSRPKRKHVYCEWCDRLEHNCIKKPCTERYKRSGAGRKSIAEMQQFAERWVGVAKATVKAGKQWYQGKIRKKQSD